MKFLFELTFLNATFGKLMAISIYMPFFTGINRFGLDILQFSGFIQARIPVAVTLSIFLLVLVSALLIVFLLTKRYYSVRLSQLQILLNQKTEELRAEKSKSASLLANVLPKNAADEIAAKGKAAKIKYNFVTVLFSDIQGFTKIAEETNPENLIDELDRFFFYFDSVVEKYRIEKIKTIGDAYMCAGGIPEKNRTNPVEVILAALEMRTYMDKLKETSQVEGMQYWDIRIGIHTGTVVAGVIGQKKLSYDIWGDTVNTASRMESSGEAGKINISGTTYEFVKDFFTCVYRGKMPVKYKGELEMYFVTSIRPELCDESGGPNKSFTVKLQVIKLQDIEEAVVKMFEDTAPPDLYFHNAAHVKNICSQVDLISTAEKLPEEEYVDLKLAAIFLLTGYLTDYGNPMEGSIRHAEEIIPAYGFPVENISRVDRIIRNSYMNTPDTFSDQILHDSRFDYLGRVDYQKLTDRLYRELTEYGNHVEHKEWIETQKKLLRGHQFMTKTGKLLRSVLAEDQISGLQSHKG